jgi:hypothetical protein
MMCCNKHNLHCFLLTSCVGTTLTCEVHGLHGVVFRPACSLGVTLHISIIDTEPALVKSRKNLRCYEMEPVNTCSRPYTAAACFYLTIESRFCSGSLSRNVKTCTEGPFRHPPARRMHCCRCWLHASKLLEHLVL